MKENWEDELSCADICLHCNRVLEDKDQRIMSVYDHVPICLDCKKIEEQRPDYSDVSKEMIAACISGNRQALRRSGRLLLSSFLSI